jgi:hypothetical protein
MKLTPFELIIGDQDVEATTSSATQSQCNYSGFLSGMEPKGIENALSDPDWVIVMQDEVNQLNRQRV